MRLGFAPFRGSNPRASAGHGPLHVSSGGGRAASSDPWLQFQLPSFLAPQRLVHPLAGVLHLEGGDVGVALGRRNSGVPKYLLHDADVHALLDQQSSGGVPGIVDPDIPDLRLAQDGLLGPPVFGVCDRAAMTGGEHQIMVRPRVARPQPFRSLLPSVLAQQLQERGRAM